VPLPAAKTSLPYPLLHLVAASQQPLQRPTFHNAKPVSPLVVRPTLSPTRRLTPAVLLLLLLCCLCCVVTAVLLLLGRGCWIVAAGSWVLGRFCWVVGAGSWMLADYSLRQLRLLSAARTGIVSVPNLLESGP
jgi:hypothetical protein